MVAKKIAVTEESEEALVGVASLPEEPDTKPVEPDTKEEVKQEPRTDIPEPSPPKPEADHQEADHHYGPELSDRLASKPRKSKKSKPLLRVASSARGLGRWMKRRPRTAGVLGVILILLIAGVYLLIKPTSSSNPLPKPLQQQVNFTVYYPTSRTGDYQYLPDSSSYAGGKLTYNLGTGGPLIHVSEQALSVQPPNLHDLQNFSVFQAPAGEAAVGVSGNVLNGVLIADKTLIILNGLGGVNMQDFIQTIDNMKP